MPSHAFTDLRLADIYTATLAVYHRSPETAGDPSALVAELTARGDLVRVGGAVEVFNLVSEGATAHALSWHGARITDAARLRALEAAAIRIQHAATSTTPGDDEGTVKVIRYAWQQLEDATSAVPTRAVMPMEKVFDSWRNRSESTSVPIGLDLFNKVTSLKALITVT